MERMIPYLVEDFKRSDYHRNEVTKAKHSNKLVDIVFLFFYNNIQQAKRGMPFCKAFWNSEICDAKVEINNPDFEINGIQIQWNKSYELMSDLMIENQMSKGEYIEIANNVYNICSSISEEIRSLEITYMDKSPMNNIFNEILKFESDINQIDQSINFKNRYTPFECVDLDSLLASSIIALSNIILSIKDEDRDETNKKSMIIMELKRCEEKLKYYKYELDKIS